MQTGVVFKTTFLFSFGISALKIAGAPPKLKIRLFKATLLGQNMALYSFKFLAQGAVFFNINAILRFM
jgi:hypothetical protein